METENTAELPRYRSHKTVWALQIDKVHVDEDGQGIAVTFINKSFAMRAFTADQLKKKPTPEPGWYMVQYEDGYTSFSPKDQFKRGNTLEPKTFKDRVQVEKSELDEKITKLTAFIGGTIFANLPDAERSRLSIQLQHMNGYSEILGQRIAAF